MNAIDAYSIQQIPHEFIISDLYMPPLLVAAFLGALAAWLTSKLFYRYHLSRFFFYPPLVSLSMTVIYTVLIGAFVIGA